jgi:hypothetical protein
VRETHFAAIVDPPKLGELLRAIGDYRGGPVVRAALRRKIRSDHNRSELLEVPRADQGFGFGTRRLRRG